MKNLKRVPGRPIVVEFSLETQAKKTKTDPNNYYRILGLDPSKSYTDQEIKKAYWERAKELHPDGSSPDSDQFHLVRVAYTVLMDEETRAQYDSLEGSSMWLDEEVIRAIFKKWGVATKDIVKAIKEASKEDAQTSVQPPPVPTFDSYAYYYYEGEAVPDMATREEWVDVLTKVMWDHGMRGEVRLGFTQGEPHKVVKPWGEVLMTSGKPSVEKAEKLLRVQPTSTEDMA